MRISVLASGETGNLLSSTELTVRDGIMEMMGETGEEEAPFKNSYLGLYFLGVCYGLKNTQYHRM